MASTFLRTVNNRGIPTIQSAGFTLTDSALTFSFNSHPNTSNNFSGLIAVKVTDTFTAPGTAVPVYFVTQGVAGSTIALTTYNGAAVTSSTWPGTGIHLVFYDRESNVLQLIS